MNDWLPLIWIGLIGFAIFLYVLLDGFDLGIGILYFLIPDRHDRDLMMTSIAPVWDGNATWLVFGGATLYGAFPLAFSLLLPTLYTPLMIMLIALLLRGVCFEFRLKADKTLFLWDRLFFLGSLVATFSQGLLLGTFVQGFPAYQVGDPVPAYQWLTPFSVFTGIALVFGYVLLGACWGIAKLTGELRSMLYRVARVTLSLCLLCLVAVSIWSPFVDPALFQRWLTWPNMLYLSPLPAVTAIFIFILWRSLQRENDDNKPFRLVNTLFIFSFIGFCISSWPYIVPRHVTLWQAASPDNTLLFMLIGTVILLPFLLFYTGYAYYIFRGKVTEKIHY